MDSSLPDNTAGALAATNLQMGGSRIHCVKDKEKGNKILCLIKKEQKKWIFTSPATSL